MKKLNTTRSDEIVKAFRARQSLCKRKIQRFEKELNAAPSVVFKQLCPSREADWINGWTVELLYTKTGYVETLCVFRTPATNIFGPGLWMITRLEAPTDLELVVFHEDSDLIEYTRIHLFDNGNATCRVVFEIILTATSEKGNTAIDAVPDEAPPFLDELAHYLAHGDLKDA